MLRVLLAIVLMAGCGGWTSETLPPVGAGGEEQLRPVGPLEEAIVTRVIDGDTILVRIGGRQARLRYIGIDAPEMGDRLPEPWAEEATEANDRLVAGHRVQLERDISDTDRFGRLLRYVWLPGPDSWTLVNLELVRSGLARSVSFPPDVRHQDWLRAAEAEARRAGAGLWADEP